MLKIIGRRQKSLIIHCTNEIAIYIANRPSKYDIHQHDQPSYDVMRFFF